MKKQILGLCLIALSACANAHMTNYTCVKDSKQRVPMQTSMAQGYWSMDIENGKYVIALDTNTQQAQTDLMNGELYTTADNSKSFGHLHLYDRGQRGYYITVFNHDTDQTPSHEYLCVMNAGEW